MLAEQQKQDSRNHPIKIEQGNKPITRNHTIQQIKFQRGMGKRKLQKQGIRKAPGK
jgi:hypothetical protein